MIQNVLLVFEGHGPVLLLSPIRIGGERLKSSILYKLKFKILGWQMCPVELLSWLIVLPVKRVGVVHPSPLTGQKPSRPFIKLPTAYLY